MRKRYVLGIIVSIALLIGCTQKEINSDGVKETPQDVTSEGAVEETVLPEEGSLFIGDTYKDFLLNNNTSDNEHLSDYLGKPILLSFWTSWSAESENFNALITEVYKEFSDEIHFISINVTAIEGNDLEYVIKYIQSKNYQFPVYFDLDGQIAKDYFIRSFPTCYILDKEGIIQEIFVGNVERETFLEDIQKILTE